MEISFENWFRRKMDNRQYMYSINFLPSISLIYYPNFYSFSIQFLFWSLTFENDKSIK